MEKDLRGVPVANIIYKEIFEEIKNLKAELKLRIVIMGKDPSAIFYVHSIERNCQKVGIESELIHLSSNTEHSELIEVIKDSNQDPKVTGIMIQKPLPKQINEKDVVAALEPDKDVDGFNPMNLGRLMVEDCQLAPCTPQAVMEVLNYYKIDLKNKHTVLCGRSNIVGKPLANLLIRKNEPGNATLTVCHSKTGDITKYTKQADVLITALGLPKYIKSDMIKDGAVLIDVGTNEIEENGKKIYVGDIDYQDCYSKSAAITPVPGGIGGVTTAVLLRNVLKAYKIQHDIVID